MDLNPNLARSCGFEFIKVGNRLFHGHTVRFKLDWQNYKVTGFITCEHHSVLLENFNVKYVVLHHFTTEMHGCVLTRAVDNWIQ